jgi:hypothetical protein
MTEQFSVRDGHDGHTRNLVFDGELIGEVSSRRQQGPRWTELRLYKTQADAYVLEKVGMSVVVHGPGCPEIRGKLPRFQATYPGADPADGSWWICDVCGTDAVRDITSLLVETNRHWAIIAEDPAQIVDALYRRKLGARSMPRMSIDLLDQAGKVDPAILDSFRSEYVY